MVSHHSVNDDEELPHACGDGHFEYFSGFSESVVECSDHGVKAYG